MYLVVDWSRAAIKQLRISRIAYRSVSRLWLSSETDGRLAVLNLCDRLLQVVIVFFPELHHAVLAVQSLSDYFVRLHELVDLTSQLVILVANHSNVVVHRVDFDLKIGVVLQKSIVRVSGTLQLLPHVEQLILFLTDLDL